MRFRRPSVKYAATPEPATPFQKAGQAWDDRVGGARVQARNWRLMAFGCLLLAAVSTGDRIMRHAEGNAAVPYLVELSCGEVQSVSQAMPLGDPGDQDIANQLARFIESVRSLSTDPVVVRKNWLSIYDYTTDRGAAFLNEYAREHEPLKDVGKRSVMVDIVSVVRASEHSFQIQWDEKTYVNGAAGGTERWTAILTIVQQRSRIAEKLRANPWGIYVDGISWSRQFSANPTPGGTS
ncbi:conjugal transfer protein TrbF [Bordetella petrii]|uniref:Conjugal transfer protein TrbF n=1 Tax=Bordetella petrii (strain ATCC BAA-461 / DSM 12804 / CCUG 43448 / CIP 107267 / Se-1111R) TaxID=340100 RepID=A9IF65_BORPD|nr:conjugal transfer protein TrbF [Bordetella petrii]MBO1112193.1 conjugal transfer protein TrbF [Bordetella petrii]MBO9354730.1 conjugal transfer protein TrbF [Bordetella petrii]CAP44975.1 conjugal transfer protein TrbF [Bordetella petrii]